MCSSGGGTVSWMRVGIRRIRRQTVDDPPAGRKLRPLSYIKLTTASLNDNDSNGVVHILIFSSRKGGGGLPIKITMIGSSPLLLDSCSAIEGTSASLSPPTYINKEWKISWSIINHDNRRLSNLGVRIVIRLSPQNLRLVYNQIIAISINQWHLFIFI